MSSWLAMRAHRAEMAAIIERHRSERAQSDAEKAAEAEKAARAAAEAARTEAVTERMLTQDALSTSERNLYFNNIDLSEREWLAGNIEHVDQLLKEAPSSLRKWEWHYLAGASHMEEAVLRGHRDAVRALAFDADGLLRTASADNTVKIWNLETHKEVSTIRLPGNTSNSITDAVFSPNGRMLYLRRTSPGNISDRKVLDLSTGKEGFSVPAPTGILAGLGLGYGPIAFAPDSRILVTTGAGATQVLQSFDLATGQEQAPFALHPGAPTRSVVLSSDGLKLAAITETGAKIMGSYVGEKTVDLEHSQTVFTPALSTDGTAFAASTGSVSILDTRTPITHNETIRLWDTSTGREGWAINLNKAVIDIQFQPGGQLIAAALDDHTIRLLNNTNGTEVARMTGHTDRISGLRFTPDGMRLVSAGSDGTVRIWRVPIIDAVALDGGDDGRAPRGAIVSPDRSMLLTLSGAILKVWNLNTRKLLLERHYDRTLQPRATGFSSDSRRVFVWVSRLGATPADVRFIDIRSNNDVAIFHPQGFTDFKLSPNGTRAALLMSAISISSSFVGRGATELQMWDSSNGNKIKTFSPKSGGDMQFSPDGNNVAIVSSDILANGQNQVVLYDANSGRVLREIHPVPKIFPPVVFSPDSQRFALITNGRGITAWDVRTGRELVRIAEQSSNISAMAFSPDGTRLVSVSSDGEIRLWEFPSGRPLVTLRASTTAYAVREIAVTGPSARGEHSPSISFSPDGNQLRLETLTAGPKGLTLRITTWDGRDTARGNVLANTGDRR